MSTPAKRKSLIDSGTSQDSSTSNKSAQSSAKASKKPTKTSKLDPVYSVTDMGAIKVSRPKRTLSKEPKPKSKAKRAKLDPSVAPVPENDASILQSSDQEGDVSSQVENEGETGDTQAEISENLIFKESSIAIPGDNARFSGFGGQNIIATAFDEIALEGLDGITLEALWLRLAISLSIVKPLGRHLMEFVWNNVKAMNQIQAYKLNNPRAKLKFSPGDEGDDPYPYKPINNVLTNEIGSCSTYDERQSIEVQEFSLKDAEVLGNCLVLVASQTLRIITLISPFVDPRLLDIEGMLTPHQYYILERIARGRRQGVTTTGPESLSEVVSDPKTLFYYRNLLQIMRLVDKQNYNQRTEKNNTQTSGLIHLRRFYTEVKSQRQRITEFIVKMIQDKPECRMEYMELRHLLGATTWDKYQISKIIKTPEFRQYVKTDVTVPYRIMYPNANNAEWRKKKEKEREKLLRVFELRNPNLNIQSMFKGDKQDEEIKDACDTEQASVAPLGIMSRQRVYQVIRQAGPEGITLRALSVLANVDHYTARNMCKNLMTARLINHSMRDSKRQHYLVYYSTEYDKKDNDVTSEEINDEEMKVDDETYDFISDVLKIEPSILKETSDYTSEQETIEPSSNNYTIIETLRRAKDNDNLNTYFANQHSFEVENLRPLRASKDRSIVKKDNIFSFLECTKNVGVLNTGSSFVPNCLFNIASTNSDRYVKDRCNIIVRHSKRKLKTFEPFKLLLDSEFTPKPIDAYIADEIDISEPLSSSDDERFEELDTLESVASGMHATHTSTREQVPESVKTAIIEHFELENAQLRDRFNAQSIPLADAIDSTPASSVEESMTPENFFNVDMEMFMGPKPRILSHTKDNQDIETMLVLSTSPEHFTSWRTLISNSVRLQSRVKLIKETIYNQKTVIDLIKMYSIVNQSEQAEGYNARVDRKSLQRIFTILVRGGDFVIIKIILKLHNCIRTKNVITDPKADAETLIQSIVDQFKNSFLMYAKRKLFEEEDHGPVVPRRFKYNRFIGRTYGSSPKVTKMRIMHEFLFYVMRGYTGSALSREEARNVLLNHCEMESIDSVMKEATTLYQREATWRMFVPPLPKHKNWPDGWALISDIFLRLPVSLFVRMYNVTYVIPELPSYLNHPVRKHFIVKNLPVSMQDALLGYRKYIFSLHEIICYLAYMGLVQFGPQKMREKDQVFIYLNTKAVIYDTTSSEHGYHHITQKEYPRMEYTLSDATAVEKYWSDMYYFAINTKLGSRGSVIGQSIKLEYVHAKPLLVATLKPQTIESAARNDIGYLPGDGLGACCSDSAIWLYVQKNWYWYSRTPQNNSSSLHHTTGLRRKHLEELRPIRSHDVQHIRRIRKLKVCNSREAESIVTRVRKSKAKRQARCYKKSVVLRKVHPRKVVKKKRIRVDMIDKNILEKMGKCRAIFNAEEDKLVLVCLACTEYLTAFNKKRSVGTTAIRDFIHRVLPLENKKTSLAYRRRLIQLRKRNTFNDQKDGSNVQIQADFYMEKHFGKLRNDLKRTSTNIITDSQLNIAFTYLALYAWKRYKLNQNREQPEVNEVVFKDYLQPGMIDRFDSHMTNEDNFCKDPTDEESVNLDTIQSVIHCSLGGNATNDQQWPFQLLKVYQTFTEDLLRTALVNMRDYQIISGKKMKNGCEGTILMSGITYNLSFNYTFKQITQFPHCIFTEAHELFMTMMRRFEHFKTKGLSFERFEHGHGLCIGEFQAARRINWVFDLPDDIITLNPNMSDFSELIKELTQRYTELMKKSQETEDGTYDPDTIKQLETTLRSYMQDESGKKETEEAMETEETTPDEIPTEIVPIVANKEESSSAVGVVDTTDAIPADVPVSASEDNVVESQEDSEERAIKTTKIADFGNYGKADRRHKSWRISDMAFMLTKGLFPELDDDERLEKLNEHFIVRYPTCRIRFNELQTRDDAVFKNWHEDISNASDGILRKVLNDALIRNIQMDQSELHLEPEAEELANYIYTKNVLGASSTDIKRKFPGIDVRHLQHVIETGLVLRVGVCNHFFVHHNFRHSWSIYLHSENPQSDNIYGGYRLRISPWIRIDGTVDDKILEKWMSIILSHCLSYPCITFNRLCTRFNIIKPVDIYYLVEILQTLKCLQIWSYVRDGEDQDIFGDFGILPQVPSSMLDDFDDVFVETESSVITKFGAFLNRHKTDFAYPFEEEE
ncbi:general transcription factor 3C polypeptide 1 isoform X2 [Atheta coriaria]